MVHIPVIHVNSDSKIKNTWKNTKNSSYENGTYPSDKCEFRFEIKNTWKNTNSSHENGTYSCDKSELSFENKEHLKTHIESVHVSM